MQEVGPFAHVHTFCGTAFVAGNENEVWDHSHSFGACANAATVIHDPTVITAANRMSAARL
jgi:hypothetical protein